MPQNYYPKVPVVLPIFVLNVDLIISLTLTSHLKNLPGKAHQDIEVK